MNKPGKIFEPLAGMLMDVVGFARGAIENPHSLLKLAILRHLKKELAARELIEIGTYLGVTAGRCAKIFDRVYTVEIDAKLFAQAREHLSRHDNVRCFHGDGVEQLPKVFQEHPVERAIVFLDGHYSGAGTGRSDVDEPAITELELLAPFRSRIAAIVVDDFRNFGDPGLPSKSSLIAAAERLFPEAKIAIHADQLVIRRAS